MNRITIGLVVAAITLAASPYAMAQEGSPSNPAAMDTMRGMNDHMGAMEKRMGGMHQMMQQCMAATKSCPMDKMMTDMQAMHAQMEKMMADMKMMHGMSPSESKTPDQKKDDDHAEHHKDAPK